jgi:hypothetical protein
MASRKTLGITLFYGVAASGTAATAFGAAGIIDSLDEFPDLNFDEFDDSAIDQTSLVKDWQNTMIDAGKIAGKLKMTESAYTALLAIHDGSKRSWKILFPIVAAQTAGAKLIMDGNLKRLQLVPGGGTNGKVLVGFEIRITSLPVFTAGT